MCGSLSTQSSQSHSGRTYEVMVNVAQHSPLFFLRLFISVRLAIHERPVCAVDGIRPTCLLWSIRLKDKWRAEIGAVIQIGVALPWQIRKYCFTTWHLAWKKVPSYQLERPGVRRFLSPRGRFSVQHFPVGGASDENRKSVPDDRSRITDFVLCIQLVTRTIGLEGRFSREWEWFVCWALNF